MYKLQQLFNGIVTNIVLVLPHQNKINNPGQNYSGTLLIGTHWRRLRQFYFLWLQHIFYITGIRICIIRAFIFTTALPLIGTTKFRLVRLQWILSRKIIKSKVMYDSKHLHNVVATDYIHLVWLNFTWLYWQNNFFRKQKPLKAILNIILNIIILPWSYSVVST